MTRRVLKKKYQINVHVIKAKSIKYQLHLVSF